MRSGLIRGFWNERVLNLFFIPWELFLGTQSWRKGIKIHFCRNCSQKKSERVRVGNIDSLSRTKKAMPFMTRKPPAWVPGGDLLEKEGRNHSFVLLQSQWEKTKEIPNHCLDYLWPYKKWEGQIRKKNQRGAKKRWKKITGEWWGFSSTSVM